MCDTMNDPRTLRPHALITAFFVCSLISCSDDVVPDSPDSASGDAIDGASLADTELDSALDVEEPVLAAVEVSFDLDGDFFDAPFPIETRRNGDGTIDYSGFPNLGNHQLLDGFLTVAGEATNGFARNGAVFFTFSGAIDPASLPQDLLQTFEREATVFFVDVDPDSPDRGFRFPVQAQFHEQAGKIRPENLLTVLPYPGFVQRPNTLYAAVVTTGVLDSDGDQIWQNEAFGELLRGEDSVGAESLAQGFSALTDVLTEAGFELETIAAAAVYRTGDPTPPMFALQEHAEALELPAYSVTGRIRDYDSYCVLEGRTELPIYQVGERPYNDIGGGHVVFEGGEPVVQWTEEVRFSLSIPKTEMPADGFPLLFYSTGQGGRYTQVVDRGTSAERSTAENGRGPAFYFADVGIASLSLESALVGPRHPTGSYEGLDFFNVVNLAAFRDNIRQAAAEFTVLARLAPTFEIAIGEHCDGVTTAGGNVTFDAGNFFIYGHSTGATISELVLAVDPAFRAGLLSGAGGSWIYNVSRKEQPLRMRTLVAGLLALPSWEVLDDFHPLGTIFQTVIDPAEAMNFGELWRERGANVLVIEGLVDGYFLPRMANALTMAAHLDLAGPAADPDTLFDLGLVGGDAVALPAGPNWGLQSGYVVQFTADDFDGHYVPFELPGPKYVYKCWLESLIADGRATVPAVVENGEAACP